MTSLRNRLSYANVMSTIAVVLTLGGATAMAAVVLAPNSVGTRQLKKSAVTDAKIKDGAVTTAKIEGSAVGGAQLSNGGVSSDKLADGSVTGGKLADGSVTTGKLADGSVTADKIDPSALPPVSGIVQRLGGKGSVVFPPVANPPKDPIPFPLERPSYIQPVGEDDQYLAAMEVTFAANCLGRRSATATLYLDSGERRGLDSQVIGTATVDSEHTGEETRVAQFVPTGFGGRANYNVAPAKATDRNFVVELEHGFCSEAQKTGTVTMKNIQIDVIGTR